MLRAAQFQIAAGAGNGMIVGVRGTIMMQTTTTTRMRYGSG